MGVVCLKYRMQILDRTTPSLTLPLQGGGDTSDVSPLLTGVLFCAPHTS
jgi:hypothetical protein